MTPSRQDTTGPQSPPVAPIRDDWAYAQAARIYESVLGAARPMTVVDEIATALRLAHARGKVAGIKEVANRIIAARREGRA